MRPSPVSLHSLFLIDGPDVFSQQYTFNSSLNCPVKEFFFHKHFHNPLPVLYSTHTEDLLVIAFFLKAVLCSHCDNECVIFLWRSFCRLLCVKPSQYHIALYKVITSNNPEIQKFISHLQTDVGDKLPAANLKFLQSSYEQTTILQHHQD